MHIIEIYVLLVVILFAHPSHYKCVEEEGKSQKGQKWIREDIILCDAVILNLSGVPEISEPKQKFHETTFACSFAFQVEFFLLKKGSKISGHCPFK